MNRADILKKVKKIICQDREHEHGSPEDTFSRIATLWSAYATQELGEQIVITAKDVAIMMTLLKVARLCNDVQNEDSWIDAIGYMTCGAEIDLKDK